MIGSASLISNTCFISIMSTGHRWKIAISLFFFVSFLFVLGFQKVYSP